MFDLSGDCIVEIFLAWEIIEMGKKLEKTVLRFNYARFTNYDIIHRLAVMAVSSARCTRCENSC